MWALNYPMWGLIKLILSYVILSYLILSYANTVLKFYIHVIIFIYLYLIVYNVQLIICLVISLL